MRARRRPVVPVAPGERLLAWARSDAGVVGGTRDALYLPATAAAPGEADGERFRRVPWEQVEAARWNADESVLVVTELAPWGEVRPEHRLVLSEPVRLLELLRERVSASVLLQRHVPVAEGRGVRVIARRAPRGAGEITWLYDYDRGVDPEDPDVVHAAAAALTTARADLGDL